MSRESIEECIELETFWEWVEAEDGLQWCTDVFIAEETK